MTELVTGIDIVAEQLRVALGEKLGITQSDVSFSGHAIECRINAEHPWKFTPCPGKILDWIVPGGPGVRVESHVYPGYVVPPHYDSLIAKLLVHGATREEAIARMRAALDEMHVDGIQTTAPLHRKLMDEPTFGNGGADIHYLERLISHWDAASKEGSHED